MSAASASKGEALAARFHREIVDLMDHAPSHGEITLSIYFADGEPTRYQQGVVIGKLARPDREARR